MATDRLNAILEIARRRAGPSDSVRSTDAQLLDRYVTKHDEAAFAAIVRRHGGLVASTCRRLLSDEADVEDAFQATFLVLIRKADSIRRRQTLACWLYRVAGRVASEARKARDRQRGLVGAASRAAQGPARLAGPTDPSWREVCEVLYAELDRLPTHLRLPLILCYLDGKTRDEAARQLGWSVGALRGRLERGRSRLRARLSRRGVELSAALLATAAAPRADAVGSALVRVVVQIANGASPSSAVTALAEMGMRVAFGGPMALAGALAVVAGLLVVVTGAGRGPVVAGGQIAKPQAAVEMQPQKTDGAVAFSGRVLGPDGKPVTGAKLYVTPWWGYHYEPFLSPESATTGPDGRFAFSTPKAKLRDESNIVSATAPNLGVGWVGILKDEKRTDLKVQLVADDVPITGQIVDLEGKPVPGATLRVLQVMASRKEELDPWLIAAKDKTAPPRGRASAIEQEYLPRYATAPSPVVTTDAGGRFRLTGIGRERIVIVQLDGPTIASEHLRIRTRPGEIVKVGDQEAEPEYGQPRIDETYYGAEFRHVAGPTKPIVGVVRDKDTKKSLPGVTVRSEKLANNLLHGRHFVQTKTDEQGCYRLVGMPKGVGNKINIVPPDDMPYISPQLEVPDSYGLEPVTFDVELKRAVWIQGRITDKATGQPLRGYVTYIVRRGNPNQRDYPGFWGGINHLKATNDDGTYRLIGLPGLGQILVRWQDGYLLGHERDDEDGLHEEFGHVPAGNFGAFARIDPAKGAETLHRDIAMVTGWTFTGTILGPDGKALIGAVMVEHSDPMTTAEFTVAQFNPRRPRPLMFRHTERGLVGIAHPPSENGGSVTVRMEPGATVIGRVVDADGMPKAGVELSVSFRPKDEPHWDACSLENPKTGPDGRFRVTALFPDQSYKLYADQNLVRFGPGLRAGETKDLGDVLFRP